MLSWFRKYEQIETKPSEAESLKRQLKENLMQFRNCLFINSASKDSSLRILRERLLRGSRRLSYVTASRLCDEGADERALERRTSIPGFEQ